MRIKQKGALHDLLYNERYDKIVFTKEGDWYAVSTSFLCWCSNERDENGHNKRIYPAYTLNRAHFHDRTHREVKDKIAEIEEGLNGGIPEWF